MRQGVFGRDTDRLLEQPDCGLSVAFAQLSQTFGVETRRGGVGGNRPGTPVALGARDAAVRHLEGGAQLEAGVVGQLEELVGRPLQLDPMQRVTGEGVLQAQLETQALAAGRADREIGAGQQIVAAQVGPQPLESVGRRSLDLSDAELMADSGDGLAGDHAQGAALAEFSVEHLAERSRQPVGVRLPRQVLESEDGDRTPGRLPSAFDGRGSGAGTEGQIRDESEGRGGAEASPQEPPAATRRARHRRTRIQRRGDRLGVGVALFGLCARGSAGSLAPSGGRSERVARGVGPHFGQTFDRDREGGFAGEGQAPVTVS